MTIALATRGYLCFPLRVIPDLGTPRITAATEDKPGITASAISGEKTPIIIGAATDKPQVGGATVAPAPTPDAAPTITSAKIQTPTIRKAKKD